MSICNECKQEKENGKLLTKDYVTFYFFCNECNSLKEQIDPEEEREKRELEFVRQHLH